MQRFSIAIHGGAGTILQSEMSAEKEKGYKDALQDALNAGYKVLENGGTSLDAVEQSMMQLENCPLFNAAKGAVFNALGKHEMDASIMEGKNRMAGAVSGVHNIQHPTSLARQVMEQTEHVFLIGEGAMDFAATIGFPFIDDDYFYDEFRYQQWLKIKDSEKFQLDHTIVDKKFGTVGAVALDIHGNLAAATSTGGMTNKKFGRVGDSPIIGAGTYANNATCAVSCTGSGEYFIRGVVAYDVSCLMEYKGLSLQAACDEVVQHRLKNMDGDGGLIAVDTQGNIVLSFNTEGMYRACRNNEGRHEVSIYK
ncbi:MAG: isoaspartyl peptidase/L-asparaginase [Saprospirales bacterium]|jgi:beta-aspartyl-peptidase (threonine type)|nr:isoaspartyl peptidase/L-asparaginase [Saprospirales bacterium]